jgi:WD40 repeat protein
VTPPVQWQTIQIPPTFMGEWYRVNVPISSTGARFYSAGRGALTGGQAGAKLRGHQDFLFAVAYSPDGRTLASGGRDGLLKLWHLPTQREVGTILELPKEIQFAQLTFSADGSWLGASDTAGNLHLFHAPPPANLEATDAQALSR